MASCRSHEQTDSAPPRALGESRATVYKLAALFSLDSFAGGFTVQSLLALWLFERFDLSLTAASLFFFWSSVLRAFSYPVAAWLAKPHRAREHDGVHPHPVEHLSHAGAFTPNLPVALGLLLLRAALSQMDVPTRTSYVMAVVTPPERTAAASITAVPRSLASAISPAIAGALLSASFIGLAAHHLRRAQDRLRPLAPAYVPPPQAAGGAAVARMRAAICGSR